MRYINYLMLHQLWQRPSDVLLQSVESHWRLVRQHVHALRKLVSYCEQEVFGLRCPGRWSRLDRLGSTFEQSYINIVITAPFGERVALADTPHDQDEVSSVVFIHLLAVLVILTSSDFQLHLLIVHVGSLLNWQKCNIMTTCGKRYFYFRVFVIVCDAVVIRSETATTQGKFYFLRATKFLDACRGSTQISAF